MRILVLLPRFPYPLDKGDKLRAYHQIVELAKRHEVHLFALSHHKVTSSQIEAMQPYCKSIHVERLHAPATWWGVLRAFLKGEPLQVGYWTTRRALRHYRQCQQQVEYDAQYAQMVRTMKYLGGLQPGSGTLRVLDFQDALSLNTRRRSERSHGPMRWLLRYEYRALQRTEQEAQRLFLTTIIAPADRNAISPDITLVPNGVDTDYFSPEFRGQCSEITSHHSELRTPNSNFSIVFTGNMSYAPNVDAACWLVNEIMPTVWKRCPYGINVLIAGADPKPAVRALAGPKVTVSGRLPDIRSAYASARIFVAPMRIGSGMQNKLLEAMAMGLPCVTTSIAATPLGATPWEHLLVGDTAEEIADLIVKLTVEEIHHSIADGGHRFVLEHFSWPSAVAPLEEILTH